ncbi:hypothetical protein O1611_g102 [Lasiodiplodia mahajangana]|uniref:Uncharacterized protein n=1 Tax=Lasiodiplodia mahajangana TaxID=1108764 RepID=A0ACC2K1Y2_9PEZI|nr:hypothetical protein O1611_g102 [Lasiodiplodia mahajangana]
MRLVSLGSSRAPRRDASTSGDDRKILVAVDFGTTHSAVAWQTRSVAQDRIASQMLPGSFADHALWRYQRRKNDHQTLVLKEWPGKTETQDKVPSTLQYNASGREDPEGFPSRWGFETEYDHHERKYQWFKLELNPNLRNILDQEYPKTTIQPKPKHVEKLVTDYLQVLREHAENHIKDSFIKLGDAPPHRVPWEYIITVPAVWPEVAQNTTRKCAVNAGMATSSPVQIVTEPEAAGLYALEQAVSQDIKFTIGDTFVICDAGGGTVDLISYTVISLKPVTRLEESAAGSGGLCGSIFLDRRFDDWLRRRVSSLHQWNDSYHADALAQWESEIKRNFNGDVNEHFFIPVGGLPDTPDLGIRESRFEIPGESVKQLFEPVVSEILGLVNSQISETNRNEKTVKAVLLAGGFGRNEYLKKRIQREVGEAIKVERMKECSTAIVRGALIRGVTSKLAGPSRPTVWVDSRITRKHYGITVWTIYDPTKHDPKIRRPPAGVDGSERIKIFQWFLRKGAKIKESEPISFYYDVPGRDMELHNSKLNVFSLTVFMCDEDVPPMYPGSCKCGQSIKLTADLNRIAKESMLQKQKGVNNELHYKIPFQIEMTYRSANISFDLVHGGINYGSMQAEYV